MRRAAFSILFVVLAGLGGCSLLSGRAPDTKVAPGSVAATGRTAPLFDDIGPVHHEISTDSKLAQRYFDQGFTFVYGFNHAEAIRAFLEAARIDPNCAICYWGASLSLGLNINAPMADEDVARAWEYLQKAVALSDKASPIERDYIQALTKRYVKKPLKDRATLDVAYANAMRKLAAKYPDDLDAQTLFAEAMMDTMPWSYWTEDLKAKPGTEEIIAALESVLQRNPNHVGALHYYIHAVEASADPKRAEAVADRLGNLVPVAGHLVHMPAHIYLRVGRYNDASEANVRAAKADERYISQCKAQGLYPAMYYPHNIHFLWYASALEGRSETSIGSARKLVGKVPEEVAKTFPQIQQFFPVPLFAYARFGRWDEILSAPAPNPDLAYLVTMQHYARGLAYAAKGEPEKAQAEAAKFQALAASEKIAALDFPDFPARQITHLGGVVLDGEVARASGDLPKAIARFEEAVKLQDQIPYMEPPYWYFPVRQYLGAVLLEAGRAKEAEAVYRADLRINPDNGWSLYGLARSLREQKRTREATEVEKQFRHAWAKADVKLESSRF